MEAEFFLAVAFRTRNNITEGDWYSELNSNPQFYAEERMFFRPIPQQQARGNFMCYMAWWNARMHVMDLIEREAYVSGNVDVESANFMFEVCHPDMMLQTRSYYYNPISQNVYDEHLNRVSLVHTVVHGMPLSRYHVEGLRLVTRESLSVSAVVLADFMRPSWWRLFCTSQSFVEDV